MICSDENECDLGTHTCHSTAQCWNTIGSYQCYCGSNNDAKCSTDCLVEGVVHTDGSQWFDQCSQCQCVNGVTTCQAISCNCSNVMSDEERQCCPQCSASEATEAKKCHLISDNSHIKEYHNGQKWLSKCQECECLVCLIVVLARKFKFIERFPLSEWRNRLLADGMSARFLPSSYSEAWPLLSPMLRG